MVNTARNSGLLKLGTKNKTKGIHGCPEWFVLLSVGMCVKEIESLKLSGNHQNERIMDYNCHGWQSRQIHNWTDNQGGRKGMCMERICSELNRTRSR